MLFITTESCDCLPNIGFVGDYASFGQLCLQERHGKCREEEEVYSVASQLRQWEGGGAALAHFFLAFGDVDWNTLEADMRFSMYWPKTWFSDLSLRFSSLTLSTRCERSSSVF